MANLIDMKGKPLTAQMLNLVFASPRDAYLLYVVLPQVDHEMPWSAALPMRYVKSKKWRLRRNKPHYNYFRKRAERVRELMREWEKEERVRRNAVPMFARRLLLKCEREMFHLPSGCFLTEDHLGDFSDTRTPSE